MVEPELIAVPDATPPEPAIDVSVIIPCHNAAAHLAETLASVSAQRDVAFEIIVVDDGSSDASVAIARAHQAPNIRVVTQANAGAAAARNHGLRLARGRNILFLDADDLIAPDHLAALTSALAGSDRHVAFGQWDRFRGDPASAAFPPRPGYRDADPVDWMVEDWRDAQSMTQCGTYLIPRNVLEAQGGWNEELSLIDDFEFFARILCGSDGVRYAPAARLYYRSGLTGSLSGRVGERAVRSALHSLLLGTARLIAREDSPRTRRAAANMLRAFDYDLYPAHPAIRAIARARATALGGADIAPGGPPRFHRLRRLIGWRAARHVQLLTAAWRAPRAAAPDGPTS